MSFLQLVLSFDKTIKEIILLWRICQFDRYRYQLTQQGWPHQRRHIPHLARRYWDYRDELSTDDGMLLKGPWLIILGEFQEEYLSRLHEGHLSAKKVQENAKQHMY